MWDPSGNATTISWAVSLDYLWKVSAYLILYAVGIVCFVISAGGPLVFTN